MPAEVNLETALRGIIPPLITPLSEDYSLDRAGLELLVEHVLSGGVHGLFILGTTGEGPSLSYDLRRELIAATVKQVGGRVPVLVGVTDTSLKESIRLARYSADCGASAVVASAPYYYHISQSELLDYIKLLVSSLPLPLMLYNIPQLTKVDFDLETVRQTLAWEKVIGIKDSSGDLEKAKQFAKVIADRPDFTLLIGPEQILADTLRAGAMGGVCGGANLFPRLLVDLYDAHLRGDDSSVCGHQEDVLQIVQLLYTIGNSKTAFINGVKCALSILGICQDYVAPPLCRFNQEERKIAEERLQQIGKIKSNGIQSILSK